MKKNRLIFAQELVEFASD